MKNTTITETMNIGYYLDAVESGILMSDADSIKKLCEETGNASSRLEDVEPHLDSEGQHDSRILRAAIEELQVQLALGKMDAAEKIGEIETRLEHGYSRIKHAVGRLERLGEDERKALRDKIHSSWIHLKVAGTIARIRLDLAKEESEARLKAEKENLIRDFEKIRNLAKENIGEAHEKSAQWIDHAKESVSRKSHNVLDALRS